MTRHITLNSKNTDAAVAKALLVGSCDVVCSKCDFENGSDECMILWRQYIEKMDEEIEEQRKNL
jgi:hypothetical protein